MLFKQAEYKNFIHFTCRSAKNVITFFKFFSSIAALKLNSKLSNTNTANYPERALSVLSLGTRYSSVEEANADDELGFDLQLKTSLLSFTANSDFRWSHLSSFDTDDQEVLISVDRWYWMVYDHDLFGKTTAEAIYKVATHWIRNNPCKENMGWGAYTVSERISSFCVALLLRQDIDALKHRVKSDKCLLSFFEQSIKSLTEHLEYYPQGITFNHVLNDLKGIATASVIIEDEEMLNAVMDLVWKELDIIVDENGFLREGSSHYQFIVARWLCELEFVLLKAGKIRLVDELHVYSEMMVSKVAFFKVETDSGAAEIPLIGDISPDLDPAWLLDYFSVISSSDQNQPGNGYGKQILTEIGFSSGQFVFNDVVYSYGDHTRINKGGWTLFIKHSYNEGSFYPSHAHEDFGSYVVFYRGSQVIIDPGRENYLLPPSHDEYCVPSAHNSLTINELPVSLSVHHYYLTPKYKKANYQKSISVKDPEIGFEINTDAVSRIRSGRFKNYRRTFLISDDKIKVKDDIDGQGVDRIGALITLANGVKVSVNASGEHSLTDRSGVKLDLIVDNITAVSSEGQFCDRYGHKSVTDQIRLSGKSSHISVSYRVSELK